MSVAAVLPFVSKVTRSSVAPPVRPGRGEGRAKWLRAAQVCLLVLLPCVCYWPAMRGEFLWDDDRLISHNPLLGSWRGLWQMWFSTLPLDYFPLTNSSFWLEWRLWGSDPTGYHLVNLALHVVSALLLWRLLKVLRVPGAWFGALLFAVHPINVASVAWISERKNSLSMVFYLASLLCFARARGWSVPSDRRQAYLAALGCYVLAVLSKSSVVMLPCVLLLFVWWQEGQLRRRDFAWIAPFFAASLAAGLLTIWFQYHRAMSADSVAHTRPLVLRALTAGHAVWFYLGKIVFPYPLAMLYPRLRADSMDFWSCCPTLSLAILPVAAAWGQRWWGRGPLVAWGYFLLTLLPVCGLATMSFFTYSDVSDHLVYVSTPAVLALGAAWISRWYVAGGARGRVALVAATMVAGACCVGCLARAQAFSTSERLWNSTLEVNPRSYAAHNNLGLAYWDRANQDPRLLILAEGQFRMALDIDRRPPFATVNLAHILRLRGNWAESAELYRRVLEHYPDAETYNNYGVVLLEAGNYAGAREAFGQAVRLEPTMEVAYYNLFGVEQADHRLPQAYAMLQRCLRLNPDNVSALCSLVLLNLDQPEPPSPAAAELMVATAERACRLTQYRQVPSLVALSKSLLAAGRPAEAATTATRARDLAGADHQPETVAAIEEYAKSIPLTSH